MLLSECGKGMRGNGRMLTAIKILAQCVKLNKVNNTYATVGKL